MKLMLQWLMVAVLACGLSACGNKGKLHSPTQIQNAEEREEAAARAGG